MNPILFILSSAVLSASVSGGYKYPNTRIVDQQDNYHGVFVKDPYRWLENDVRNSTEVKAWVDSQNDVTFAYLNSIVERDVIKSRLRKLWNYEKYSTPFVAGGRYFYFKNTGLQNQNVLYYQDKLEGDTKLVIDPNTWSKDGVLALAQVEVSPNGRYIAYGIQNGGSDWRTWRIKDLKTNKVLKDELKWLKFTSVSWDRKSKGFYYSRYPRPKKGAEFQSLNKNQKVYYHKVGQAQKDDKIIYQRPDEPDWGFGAEVSNDGRYLLITTWRGTDARYRLSYFDLTKPQPAVVDLVSTFEHDFNFLGSVKNTLYFKTSYNAPKGQIISINLQSPQAKDWKTIIPETQNVLESASWIGNTIITHYLKDARSLVRTYTLTGESIGELTLPGIGSVQGLGGNPDNKETFYSFSSFNTPPVVYHYDLKTKKSTEYKKPKTAFSGESYVVKQVFYPSKDGTKIPMFIVHKKSLKLDGNQPTLLYGYGGFNISLKPRFSITRFAWMEMGGIYAVANLRGGGEYGEKWHKAGTKHLKQNVFDDFIAAGEYLIEKKYTNSEKLGIAGGSNGGLLVGAVSLQRPKLFAVALPAVGVMDMLRFNQFTAGRFWVDDYGSPDNPDDFKALYAYSPYHNIKPGVSYPATLITTADTDDRVVPGHSFKFAAALQKAHSGKSPVMIRIETRAGHGSGKPTEMIIDGYADRWAFLLKNLGMKLPRNYN